MKKDIIILSAAFFLIFLSFNTAQQYFAAIYSDFGKEKTAFYSLALIYLFFFIGTFFAPLIAARIGLKKSMIIASLGFAAFVAAIPLKTDWIMIALSVVLGLGAALLWTAQGAYVIRTTDEKNRAKALGVIISSLFLGSFLGVAGASFLIKMISLELLFFLLAGIAALGTFLLMALEEREEKIGRSSLKGVFLLMKTRAVRFFPLFFTTNMLLGFFVGVVALHLKDIGGIDFAGRVSSVFWISGAIVPFLSGAVADKFGKVKALKLLALLLIISAALLFIDYHPAPVIVGVAIWGLFIASVNNVGLAAISDISKDKEAIAAFFQFSLQTGAIFAFLISAIISYQTALYITGALGLASLITLFFVKEESNLHAS